MAWLTRIGTIGVIAGGAALVGATSAFAAPVTVAVYHMEEDGALIDAAGGDNNGVLRDVRAGVSGKVGLGYAFNGDTSVATVPDSPNLDPGTANITYQAWVKLTKQSSTVDMDILRKGTDSTSGGDYKLDLSGRPSSVRARCEVDDTNGNSLRAIGGRNINDGRWHQLKCERVGTSLRLYVDGVRVVSVTNNRFGSITNDDPLTIGAKPYDIGDYFDGKIDEVKIKIG